jgi:hypothetical protein
VENGELGKQGVSKKRVNFVNILSDAMDTKQFINALIFFGK